MVSLSPLWPQQQQQRGENVSKLQRKWSSPERFSNLMVTLVKEKFKQDAEKKLRVAGVQT